MKFIKSKFLKSAVYTKDYPKTYYPEIAFVGRSNVGKSSLINCLLERKLVAKVSSTPGKTRLINFFSSVVKLKNEEFAKLGLVDLPGYGFTKVKKNIDWERMVTDYLKERKQLKGIILISDIRRDIDQRDIFMVDTLKYFGLPYIHVLSKSDKIKKNDLAKQIKKNSLTSIMAPFSTLKKQGISTVYNWIENEII